MIAILNEKEIIVFDNKNRPIKRLKNPNNSTKLRRLNQNLLLISPKTISVYDIHAEQIIQQIQIQEWSVSAESNKSICFGQTKIQILNQDLSLITVQTPFKQIKDVSMSKDGSYVFVLDADDAVTILSEENGFEPILQTDVPNAVQILPWHKSNFVTYSIYGVISFFNFKGKQMRSKNVNANSVLRQIDNGFLMFEPQDKIGSNPHFDIIKYTAVSMFEIYKRSCETGLFDKALQLVENYGFDKDIYHKAFLEQNQLTRKINDDHLRKISDKNYAYNFCVNAPVINPNIAIALITEGLRVKPKDEVLLRLQQRIEIFRKLPRQCFLEQEWKTFKFCDMKEEMMKWARREQFEDIAIVLKHTEELTQDDKNIIINSISPFVEPAKYKYLMPSNKDYFIQRSYEVDDKIGQTEIIIQILEIRVKNLTNEKKKILIFSL